jgi:molybdopterin synthase sulfur carrier subunit
MKLTVLFFASLRETLGRDREIIEVPASVATVGALRIWLHQRGGVWAQALAEGRPVRAALDQAMVGPQAVLHEGAEVAFFPPVTGG